MLGLWRQQGEVIVIGLTGWPNYLGLSDQRRLLRERDVNWSLIDKEELAMQGMFQVKEVVSLKTKIESLSHLRNTG